MYIDVFLRKSGEYVRLLIFVMSKIFVKCFEFWYYMFGLVVGSLKLRKRIGFFVGVRIWLRFGN